jgi:hypothetical protein
MADLPKDNESTLNPQRTEETHKPARGAAGGRHEPESKAEAAVAATIPGTRKPTGGRTARRRATRSGGRWPTR